VLQLSYGLKTKKIVLKDSTCCYDRVSASESASRSSSGSWMSDDKQLEI
jgi:hypothetical protein